MIKRILLAFLILPLLAGCGNREPNLETGQVIAREFTPAHWEGGWEEDCDWGYEYSWESGEYESGYHCDDYWEDQQSWVSDAWRLRLQKCPTKVDGKCQEAWRYVTEDEYNRHQTGDWYPEVDEHPND